MIRDRDNKRISVVIVTYNSENTIERCLRGLMRSELICEVIVVDNDSQDGTVSVIENKFPDVVLMERGVNAGFGPSVNYGVSFASGEYILILNPDAYIEPPSIKRLLSHFEKDEELAMTTGAQYTADGSFITYSKRRSPSRFIILLDMLSLLERFKFLRPVSDYLMLNDIDKTQYIEVASGACMLVRRDVFLDIGGFDEDFFLFGEDIDICDRITKNAYRILYDPKVKLIHLVGESRKSSRIRSELAHIRSSSILLQKRRNFICSRIFAFIALLFLIFRRVLNLNLLI